MKIKLIDFGFPQDFIPLRAHDNDAGADVFSPISLDLLPGCIAKIPLGFGLELPDGCVGFVFPRSGLSAKGITCELPPIDSRYSGEIHAVVTNNSTKPYQIMRGDRIGQLVVLPVVIPEYTIDKFDERGTGAFGSSGT